jgi:pimeloyl-ACP methyl ester carboxylesterase
LKHRAHRIDVPILIVWGKADRIIAPAYAQEFARRIAGARVELIDKAGHLPHLEQPDAVVQAVHKFLGS